MILVDDLTTLRTYAGHSRPTKYGSRTSQCASTALGFDVLRSLRDTPTRAVRLAIVYFLTRFRTEALRGRFNTRYGHEVGAGFVRVMRSFEVSRRIDKRSRSISALGLRPLWTQIACSSTCNCSPVAALNTESMSYIWRLDVCHNRPCVRTLMT